jgi:hypothetical protein
VLDQSKKPTQTQNDWNYEKLQGSIFAALSHCCADGAYVGLFVDGRDEW